jgi:hypothetical protein
MYPVVFFSLPENCYDLLRLLMSSYRYSSRPRRGFARLLRFFPPFVTARNEAVSRNERIYIILKILFSRDCFGRICGPQILSRNDDSGLARGYSISKNVCFLKSRIQIYNNFYKYPSKRPGPWFPPGPVPETSAGTLNKKHPPLQVPFYTTGFEKSQIFNAWPAG